MSRTPYNHIVLARRPMKYDHRDWRMGDHFTAEARLRASQVTANEWAVDHILNQGKSPHCVGFGWAGFGISLPIFDNWGNSMGDEIYYAAKVIDKEPGQENGSDTRSGAKAFMQFGSLKNGGYAFANSMQDVIDWLLTNGPVITGTNWYDDMFSPDSSGLVKIGGSVAGGHEWELSGVDTVRRLFKATNSWDVLFGVKGQFYIGFDDYQRLLNEQGDACVAMEVAGAPTPPPPQPSGCLSAIALGLRQMASSAPVSDNARVKRALLLAAKDLEKSK